MYHKLSERIALALLVTIAVGGTINLHAAEEGEAGDASKAADRPAPASDEGRMAMQSFRKPEGWGVSLFAAEPELANPVAMYVDHLGRVFVCESFRQGRGVTDNRKHDQEWLLSDLAAQSVQDRIDYHKRLLGSEAAEYTAHDDRIRLLIDSDGDGEADQAKMFAEGFNGIEEGTGAGVLFRGKTAYYTCIPNLWALTDEDGDGVADSRKALHTGYGVRVAFRGHDSHGLIIGPDGRLYFSIGDRGYNIETDDGHFKNAESGAVFRCELDGSNLEIFATGLRNPQELAFDDYGYLFTGDNNSDSGDKARWVNVMEGGDTGWRMMYQYLPDRGPFNREKIWYPYSDETPAYTVPPIANISDGPSGLTCYPGTGLSGDYDNCFFLVDFRGGPANSGIRLIRTQPRGAFWEVERSEQPIWNILATDADFGPDGALWVCDWVNGWVGEGKGRVYRFFDQSQQDAELVKEVQSLLADGMSDKSADQLGELLVHPDRRIRLEAQWELATRGELGPLAKVASDRGQRTVGRLHGVWGIGQAARLDSALRGQAAILLSQLASDDDLDIRGATANVIGDLRLKELSAAVVKLIADQEPRVQYYACLAAGKLHLAEAMQPTIELLRQNDNRDPAVRHAGIMTLTGQNDMSKVAELIEHDSQAVRIAAVVALRKRNDPAIVKFLEDTHAAVRLEAARAINDVPEIAASSLEPLAKATFGYSDSEAFIHRVLNANFRLGQATNAQLIASVAADAQYSELIRVEAMEMLAAWGTPGPLDRVMNRYQPLEDRDPVPAKQALAAVFSDAVQGTDDIVNAALQAAVALKLASKTNEIENFVQSKALSPNVRAEAVRSFVALSTKDAALPLLAKTLQDSNASVRSEALAQLAALEPASAIDGLSAAVDSSDVAEFQAAWDTLGNIKLPEADRIIDEGIANYIAGKLPAESWLNVLEASADRLSDERAQQLAAFQQEQTAAASLDAYRECEKGGDIGKGADIFFNKTELSCVRCHKVEGTGGEVGPDLTEIAATKDARYLLEAIVHPDAKIAEKFETVVLLTEDDQILTGILRAETPTSIELVNAEGQIVRIDPDEVLSRKKGKSAMPADLVKSMTRRELRDLVAYLASLDGKSTPAVEQVDAHK